MPMFTRPIGQHTQTTFSQKEMLRASAPAFRLPSVRAMREPTTNYMTTITATGPATFER